MALTGPIAILGWGSLIWDLDDLAPWVSGDWAMRAGPRLPMEFSRISPKRKMGLVLCLDAKVGAYCATHVIRSARDDLAEAVADLARRERADVAQIGWADDAGRSHTRSPEVAEAVGAWCRANGHHAAIWTDLVPNFQDVTQMPFTISNARDYLQSLRGESLSEAFRYIRNAPATTRTPLRRALAADPWWRSLRQSETGSNRSI